MEIKSKQPFDLSQGRQTSVVHFDRLSDYGADKKISSLLTPSG